MKTSGTGRFLKLASMTASITAKSVGHKIKNLTSSEEQKEQAASQLYKDIGLQIANTLGEMKGAVMKVGQMLSQYQEVLPPEFSEPLKQLQRAAPPVAFSVIKTQVEKELKRPLGDVFSVFEEQPFASASIGQVHKATLANSSEQVIVKVQYPGVEDACVGDLQQLKMLLKLSGLIKVSKATQDALFKEFETALFDELDYSKEAHNLEVFKAFHANLDSKVIIPSVYRELSTKKLLILSEETGFSLDEASQWTAELKEQLGYRLVKALADQIFILNAFHCDPHPGNFSFRQNGELVIYDFGGIKQMESEHITLFKTLLVASQQQDVPLIETCLKSLKIRTDKGLVPKEFLLSWNNVISKPLNGTFNFANSKVHFEILSLLRNSTEYAEAFQPSPITLMSNRMISGHYWNLVNLKTKLNLDPIIHSYLH